MVNLSARQVSAHMYGKRGLRLGTKVGYSCMTMTSSRPWGQILLSAVQVCCNSSLKRLLCKALFGLLPDSGSLFLFGCKYAPETHFASEAELAVHGTANLRGNAQGGAGPLLAISGHWDQHCLNQAIYGMLTLQAT